MAGKKRINEDVTHCKKMYLISCYHALIEQYQQSEKAFNAMDGETVSGHEKERN